MANFLDLLPYIKITWTIDVVKSESPESHWNHRVLATEQNGEMYFQIHEVHYKNGKPEGYTANATTVGSEDMEGLKWILKKMQECLSKPILWAGERFPEEYVVIDDLFINLFTDKYTDTQKKEILEKCETNGQLGSYIKKYQPDYWGEHSNEVMKFKMIKKLGWTGINYAKI